ncbi:hypothetical protein PHMEG_00031716 [Phytophthora megakarya]|uniref:DDE-1 domain-containing protein n=1 Tax=Phytophthora megakarya TaxID=4795 RepID=A0A225UW76_9STRA|nr:hypothetical protein PHMEG_00031716 [Phytophthora megakarya]
MEKPRRQNHYTVKQRREVLERVAVDGCKPTARALNIPLGTLKGTTKGLGTKSKITFERDFFTFMKDVRREEEYLCTGVMIAYIKMEQGAWLELYLSDISSPEILLLDNSDSHVSEAGQNIVADETSAIVRPVPAKSTSVSQLFDVGVMWPLKKKLSAEWLREKVSKTRTAKQKRLGAIMHTIRACEDISADFENAIPNEPEVLV